MLYKDLAKVKMTVTSAADIYIDMKMKQDQEYIRLQTHIEICNYH